MNNKLEAFTNKIEDCVLSTEAELRENILMEIWTLFTENDEDEIMALIAVQLFGESKEDISKALNKTSASLNKLKEEI